MSFAPPSRSSTSPQPVVLWDPYTTLTLERDERCVGEAKSAKPLRKCGFWLARANINEMQKLLRKLSTRQPDANALEPLLARVAGYGLCRHPRTKHQEQNDSVVQKWKAQILAAYPTGTVETVDTAAPDSVEAVESSASDTVLPPSSTPRATPSPRISSALDDIDLELLLLVRQVLQGLDALSTRSTSRVPSETPISTTELPGTSAPVSRTASPAPTLRRSVSTHTLSPPAHVHTHPTPCPLTFTAHVPRREIDAECPICREPAADRAQMTWCRGGCGRSMHAECVEMWRAARMEHWLDDEDMDLDTVFRCTMCRTEWVDCECED